MTLDKFTIKAQEAVQEAVNTAQRNGQQTIEPTHLLAGVMAKAKDVTNFLFQKLGVNGQQIEMLIQQELKHLPRVQGGEPYLSSDANRVLLKAQDYAQKMGDEFVSCEPILLALFTEGCRYYGKGLACRHSGTTPGTEGAVAEWRRELSESGEIR